MFSPPHGEPSGAVDRPLFMVLLCVTCLTASILLTTMIVITFEAAPALGKIGLYRLLFDDGWHPSSGSFGLLPMIASTALVAFAAMTLAAPFGLLSAVFLTFYASPRVAGLYRRLLELLAGIPSVVYGFWGLTVVVPAIMRMAPPGSSLLAAAVVLALMVFPTITLIATSSLQAVPRQQYYCARSLGFAKEASIWKIMVPLAAPGLTVSMILGLARAAGETMAVMMVAGNVVQLPASLFDPVRTLSANIALEIPYAIGLHRSSLFASGLIMLVFVLATFAVAVAISHRAVNRNVDLRT